MDTTEAGTLQLEGGTLPLPFADALAPPVRLGPYDDVRPFACGGMGMVCRARQRMPEREVAVKVLRAGTRASAAQKERFLREIRLAANLDHPGIVPVFDAGEQDGWLYFVMPFLEDAESLIDHAVSQRLDWRARVGLAVRAADIVEVLHRGGMLHRDLTQLTHCES
jgi:serine/threonine-protein kinase